MDIKIGSFIWDAEKELVNIHKHKVDFHAASLAFKDPKRKIYKDSKHNQDLDCPRTPEEWDGWDDSKFSKKAFEEPVKYLAKTPFFSADKEAFSIHPKYAGLFQTNSFVEHFRDVIELRRCEYFSREKFNSTGTNK